MTEPTAGEGRDNGPVRDAATHAAAMNQYSTPKNMRTLSAAADDILYGIRASATNDRALVNGVSVKQRGDFFLYVKEVHSLVANARSFSITPSILRPSVSHFFIISKNVRFCVSVQKTIREFFDFFVKSVLIIVQENPSSDFRSGNDWFKTHFFVKTV